MARKNRTFNQWILWLVLLFSAVLMVFMFVTPKTGFAKVSAEPMPEQSAASLSFLERQMTPPPIDQLTRLDVVAGYLIISGKLPDYYIIKGAAQEKGWDAVKGNLCEILPGRAIGGDRFGNWEAQLPNRPDRTWYEADINYDCGRRGPERLVYSNDGLMYVTTDHYKSFRQLRGMSE